MNIEELTARLDKLEGMVKGLLQIQGIEASRVVAPEEASSAPLAGTAPLLPPQEEPEDAPAGVIPGDNKAPVRQQSPPAPPQPPAVRQPPEPPAPPATIEPPAPPQSPAVREPPAPAPPAAIPQPASPVAPPAQAVPRLPSNEPPRPVEQSGPARNENVRQQGKPRPVTMPTAESPQPAEPQLAPSPPSSLPRSPSPAPPIPQASPSPVAATDRHVPLVPPEPVPPTQPGHGTSRPIGPKVERPRAREGLEDAATGVITWDNKEFVQHGEVFKPRTHTEPQEQSPAPPPKPSAPLPQPPLPLPPNTPEPTPAQQAAPPPQVPQNLPPTFPVAAPAQPPPRQPTIIPAQIPVANQAVPANPPPPEPTPREQRQHRAAWRAEQRRENIRSQGRQTNVDRMDEPYRAAYYDAAGIPEPPKSPATTDAMRAPRSGGDERLAEFAEVTASTLHIMQQRLTLAMRQIEEMRNTFEMAAHE